MAQDNFIIKLLASLKKPESKKQIKSDIKDLGDIKIPLIGALSKTKTRAQLKQDLSSVNGTIKLTGKVDKKGVITSVQQATQQAQKAVKSQPVQIDVTVKKEKLINDIKLLAQQNSRLFKNANMTAKYNSLLDSAKLATSNTELSNLRTQLGSLRSELKVTGNAGMTMTDALKNGLSKIFQLFGGHGIITQFTKQLRNAWTEAKNLDSKMTDLARVNAEISRDKFPDYLDKCISKCRQLSVAVEDYIASVTTFSRAGYNLADSEALADMAVQLQKVGDMDAETASKALLSGIQAYSVIDGYGMNQLAEKAQALNDKIDLIGNTASITQKEVANGIEAVGSVIADANTSVDEFIALLGAGNRATQDANKVALAIRTSALRIRSCTAELDEMGEETDNVIASTADLAEQIKGLTNIDGNGGVDILEADGETFRSIFDIYNDISKVYDKMSDTNASSLLELIAGKNRSSQISAILANMAEANDLLNQSLNAAGTASAEYQVYLESAEAATERFGVAMTESYNNILNGETVKALADTGTAVLEFANKFGLLESTLKGFLAIGVMKGIGTLTTAIKGSIVQVTNFGTALKTVGKMESLSKGTQKYITALDDLKKSCVGLTDAQLKQVLSNTSLGKSEQIKILKYQGLTNAQAKAKLAQMGLTQATNAQSASNTKATISTFSFSAAVKGLGANLKAAFLSNPIGISIMVISTLIGIATSAISKHNQKLEETRQKAAELANAYKEQQKSLDSQIKKYKELKESLDSGNLSTEETRSIKEQLLEIQNSLVDSYGNEASNIDLVNGKYQEQLGLLEELSKEKAADYVIQYRDKFDTAKKELEKIRTYDLGSVTSWTSKVPKTEDQQKLIEFIEAYSDLFDLQTKIISYGGHFGGTFTNVTLSVKADAEDAEVVIKQFAEDLEKYAEENNIDVSSLLKGGIPEQARNIWTDELEQYKTIYDEFMKAEIVRNDTLRPLYRQSIQAVEDYNKALSSGDGVEEAKANLETLQQSVQEAVSKLDKTLYSDLAEGSQEIFDDIYEGINKNAEAAYNISQTLSQAFENDDTVKQYAEQLRGLYDKDLEAINFDNNNTEKGEEAFKGLIDALGLTEEQAQTVIDKLVELGYVQGKVVNQDAPETPDPSASISQLIDQLNTQLKPAFDSLKSAYQNIFADNKFNLNAVDIPMLDKIKSEIEELNKLEDVDININMDDFDTFAKIITDVNTTKEQAQQAFDDLATAIFNATGATEGMTDETVQLVEQLLESLGVVNAHEVAQQALNEAKAQAVIASYDLIEASEDEYVAILNEAVAAGTTRQEIYRLIAAEIAFGNNDLSVEQKISKLQELARAYGDTATAAMATAISKDLASGNTDADTAINDLMTKLNAGLSKVDIDFSGIDKSASKAGSSAGKAFTDALDKELNALDKKMDAGYIDFNDYIQARLNLIEDYYRQGKLSADEYYSYLNKHYDTQLSYMDKVVNAVSRRINAEIEDLQKNKNDVEEYYRLQIESLQKEKSLLEDANKQRQLQLDLQQSLYALEKANNQRTKLVYKEGVGMVYETDPEAIRSAQDEVKDAQYQIQISEIEKSISKLEEARDNETSAIDDMISKLNEYANEWKNIANEYIWAQEDLIAAQVLGAEWETDILNGRLDTLRTFKDEYISIQQAMVDAAHQAAQALANSQDVTISDTSGGKHIDLENNTPSLPKTSDSIISGAIAGAISGATSRQLIKSHKYGSGTNNAEKGLNLVGEDGAEVYFDNHDHVAIVTKPTLIPMEGGEVVKNEQETKKLLDPDNIQSVDNIGITNGEISQAKYTTLKNGVKLLENGTIIKPDGTELRPIQPGDKIYDLTQKFNAYIQKQGSMVAPISAMQKDMERLVNSISTVNNVSNSNSRTQQVINQNITLNCPNVTNDSGVEYIQKELGHLSQMALQESMKH